MEIRRMKMNIRKVIVVDRVVLSVIIIIIVISESGEQFDAYCLILCCFTLSSLISYC